MAEVELSDPIGTLRGDLRKRGDLYARMLYGKCVIQKKPRRSSEKQRAMRKAFGSRYGGKPPWRDGEVLMKSWGATGVGGRSRIGDLAANALL